jgi:hypothetical protein
MTRPLYSALVVVGAFVLCAPAAAAQANLSAQGFGFPTGQFSSRAYGTGGAIAEFDPFSPINPASLSVLGTRTLYFQIEPEYRDVTGPGGTDRTTTARYPNVLGALPFGTNWMIGVSASTLLDRTSSASFNTTQVLSTGDTVPTTTTYDINGAMDDIRLAVAWTPAHWLRLGVGAHAITGRNVINLTDAFTDTAEFSGFTEQRTLGFRGSALSAGAEIVAHDVQAAFSMRQGGALNLSSQDTTLGAARVPNRYGASLAFTGFTNSTIAVRTSRDDWSSLGALGTPGLVAVDAWDTSVGADIAGPHFGQNILFLRGGYRTRTLPFQAAGHNVTETSFSGGLGTTFAAGHVITDLALIHADRSAGLPYTEQSWTMSIGIAVRP